MRNKNKSIKIILNYVVGPFLFVILSYVLYRQIMNQPDWETKANRLLDCWKNPLLYLSILLVAGNWGLETLKWKWLIQPLEQISYGKALKGVLAGCSITMLTPNRIGEYGGRIIFLNPENRINAIPLTILGSMCQLCITFFAGSIGLVLLNDNLIFNNGMKNKIPYGELILIISILVTITLAFFIFASRRLSQILMRWPWMKKTNGFLNAVSHIGAKQMLRVLVASFFRYSVFILQYVFLLWVMGVDMEIGLALSLLSVFYLLIALAPTIGFTELPLRAGAAVYLLGQFHPNVLGIEAATFGIWIINLVMPAIAGTLVLWKIKLTK